MADTLVLCYHALSETWDSPLAIRPGALAEQLETVLVAGYVGATFSEALAVRPRRPTVVVTFDDAYRSVLEVAAPILERLGLPGTIFVPTAFPDAEGPLAWPGIDQWVGTEHERELTSLTWDEIAQLGARDWEIGSHTCSHPRLPDLGDERLADELDRSRAVCTARLGATCRSIAYPYGATDPRVVRAARGVGYAFGAGLLEAPHARGRMAWPRVCVSRDDDLGRFRRLISPWLRRARAVSPTAVRIAGRTRQQVRARVALVD